MRQAETASTTKMISETSILNMEPSGRATQASGRPGRGSLTLAFPSCRGALEFLPLIVCSAAPRPAAWPDSCGLRDGRRLGPARALDEVHGGVAEIVAVIRRGRGGRRAALAGVDQLLPAARGAVNVGA